MPPKRAQPTLPVKQDALRLLGARADGTFGEAETDPESGLRWTAVAVAKRYSVSKAAIFAWKKNAAKLMSLSLNSRKAQKLSRMKDGHFPDIELALATYMRQRMVYMRGESLFRADVVSKAAVNLFFGPT